MTTLAKVSLPDEEAWLKAIGKVIWCMGQIEYLIYDWCNKLGGVALRDTAINKTGFRGRYDIVVAAVERSGWPDNKKMKSLILWNKAKCFANFRNKVAHAPVVVVKGVSILLDVRQLRGSIGPKPVRVYRPEFLELLAHKIQTLARQLDVIINSTEPIV